MPAKTLRLSDDEWDELRDGLNAQSQNRGYGSRWERLARKVAYQATFQPMHAKPEDKVFRENDNGQFEPVAIPDPVNVVAAVEIKPGHNYLVSLDGRAPSAEEGNRYVERLRARFPGSEFAIIDGEGRIGVQESPDLAEAFRKVAGVFPAYSELGTALRMLAREFAQERGGAATPPADLPSTTPGSTGGEQADESATSAVTEAAVPPPSHGQSYDVSPCGAHHRAYDDSIHHIANCSPGLCGLNLGGKP